MRSTPEDENYQPRSNHPQNQSRFPRTAHKHTISDLPQVKGKTLESLEHSSLLLDYKGISLSFQDKSCVDLKIEMLFTVKADYLDQKTGRHCVLKKWPHSSTVRSR